MHIIIRNQTTLPNKYIRFLKWKSYQLKRKFKHLHYVEIFLQEEGTQPKEYHVSLRLGIPGNDIILKNKSSFLGELFQHFHKAAHRQLAKTKPQPARSTR